MLLTARRQYNLGIILNEQVNQKFCLPLPIAPQTKYLTMPPASRAAAAAYLITIVELRASRIRRLASNSNDEDETIYRCVWSYYSAATVSIRHRYGAPRRPGCDWLAGSVTVMRCVRRYCRLIWAKIKLYDLDEITYASLRVYEKILGRVSSMGVFRGGRGGRAPPNRKFFLLCLSIA